MIVVSSGTIHYRKSSLQRTHLVTRGFGHMHTKIIEVFFFGIRISGRTKNLKEPIDKDPHRTWRLSVIIVIYIKGAFELDVLRCLSCLSDSPHHHPPREI